LNLSKKAAGQLTVRIDATDEAVQIKVVEGKIVFTAVKNLPR
jgi:hypothetical protein